jgi:hypothetical protein
VPLGWGRLGAKAGTSGNRSQNVLGVVQVALALMPLVGAGLIVRTLRALTDVEPGFGDPERIQFARIFIPPTVMLEPARFNRAFRETLDRIELLQGVIAAGFGDAPLGGAPGPGVTITVDGRAGSGESPPTELMSASPGQFEALGTLIVAGRAPTWADIDGGPNAVLVSDNLARELWGEPQAALGGRIRVQGDAPGAWREIVGVTDDLRAELYRRPPRIVFLPPTMGGSLRAITYSICSDRAGAESLVNEVRQAVWASHPDVAVFDVRTMQDIYAASLATTSFVLVVLASSSALALTVSLPRLPLFARRSVGHETTSLHP